MLDSVSSNQKCVIVVCGPTASGKTALAIKLASFFNTEIVNSDSRQIYKELNIGVAKPDAEELATVKHHLISTNSITKLYGAGDFEKDALAIIHALHQKHKFVVVVGGTGMYLKALYQGLDDLPGADEKYRNELNEIYKNKGVNALQELLLAVDPLVLNTIDKQNPQRLMRALEIIKLSGKKYSELMLAKKAERSFVFIKIGVQLPREQLYKNINSRVDQMMQLGLLDEVTSLLSYKNFNALKTVGYTELFKYLNNEWSLNEAVNKIKQHTRNYAKRQITWFNADKDVKWFFPNEVNQITEYIKHFTQ